MNALVTGTGGHQIQYGSFPLQLAAAQVVAMSYSDLSVQNFFLAQLF
jgi:hypothetical protein